MLLINSDGEKRSPSRKSMSSSTTQHILRGRVAEAVLVLRASEQSHGCCLATHRYSHAAHSPSLPRSRGWSEHYEPQRQWPHTGSDDCEAVAARAAALWRGTLARVHGYTCDGDNDRAVDFHDYNYNNWATANVTPAHSPRCGDLPYTRHQGIPGQAAPT